MLSFVIIGATGLAKPIGQSFAKPIMFGNVFCEHFRSCCFFLERWWHLELKAKLAPDQLHVNVALSAKCGAQQCLVSSCHALLPSYFKSL